MVSPKRVARGTDKTGPKIDRTHVRYKYLRLGLTGSCLRACDYRSDRPSQRKPGQRLVDGAAGLQVGAEQDHLPHLEGLLVEMDLSRLQRQRGRDLEAGNGEMRRPRPRLGAEPMRLEPLLQRAGEAGEQA